MLHSEPNHPIPAVVYHGLKIIAHFYIINITNATQIVLKRSENLNKTASKFTLTMQMRRNYNDQVVIMFFTIFLLWCIAYVCMFLKTNDISNRNRITVATLLFHVALNGSIKDSLPNISYFKFVDIWLLFYIYILSFDSVLPHINGEQE